MTFCVFDLETKYLMNEVDSNYSGYSWTKKKEILETILPKLGLAVGGIMFSDGEALLFEEGQEKELIKELESQKKIVGYNTLEFDYPVLSFTDKNIGKRLEPTSFDMFSDLKRLTGNWCALDSLCKLNIGMGKNFDTLKIPKMWRTEKKEERQQVKNYLKNDLEMTLKLFQFGLEKKKLKFEKKDYGRLIGIEECKINW